MLLHVKWRIFCASHKISQMFLVKLSAGFLPARVPFTMRARLNSRQGEFGSHEGDHQTDRFKRHNTQQIGLQLQQLPCNASFSSARLMLSSDHPLPHPFSVGITSAFWPMP